MSNTTLLLVIAAGTFVILGVSITGYVFFMRFIKREKEQGHRLQDLPRPNQLPPDNR